MSIVLEVPRPTLGSPGRVGGVSMFAVTGIFAELRALRCCRRSGKVLTASIRKSSSSFIMMKVSSDCRVAPFSGSIEEYDWPDHHFGDSRKLLNLKARMTCLRIDLAER
jgi:hypothetical protein